MKINNFLRTILKTRSYILISIIVLILAFLCNSCSTNANKGTISGTVILVNDTDNPSLNPVDYAGVTVALYKTAVLDTTLVRINQQYPQIGVQITQETEFDHRNFDPIKVVTTDADGKFSFPSLSAGNYNLVLWKTDWGIRYICSVRAEEKENNNLGTIELYPATSYDTPIVSEPTTFKSDHSYFILTDVNFTSSVEFQPRTQIFINPACIVKFYGAITTPEFTSPRDMWKITSGKEIYSTSQVTMDFDSYYSAVNFYGDEINLRSGIINYGSNALSTTNININIINYFRINNCGTALTLTVLEGDTNISYLTISNCNAHGISCRSNLEKSNVSLNISHCILNKIKQDGASIYISGTYYINNCYFDTMDIAIRARYCNGDIRYNIFIHNIKYNIYNYRSSSFNNEIHYNNFYKSIIGIKPSGLINNITDNNFYGIIDYFIDIIHIVEPYSYTFDNVNATNNYWSVEDVDKYLKDAEDNPRCPYHIIYLPKLLNPVINAGIQ